MSAFDIIGAIAVLPLFTKNPKKEAVRIMNDNRSIKSVYMKAGKISGRLRRSNLKFISGERKKETVHRESGCVFKLDVEKCYFSPRLGNDRLDVAKKVKPGEKVLVMFSGVGPYPIVIAKNSRAKEVYGIELNRIATKYALENARLNKLGNVKFIQGDVKKIIPKLSRKIKFDRIIMARPQLKDDFLASALQIAKEGTIIHFYDFLQEEDMPEKAYEKINNAVGRAKKKLKWLEAWKLIGWKKALEIGPRKWRIRADFFVF